jgi:hypothetical protein
MRNRIPAVSLALVLGACGSDPDPAPRLEWVPVAGMRCANGSPTGVGLSRGSANLLVFLNGGGACWGAGVGQCNADPGPFGAAELSIARTFVPGTILDRDLPGNPFAGWTMVFVPYCTGDVHAGDRADITPYGWLHHGWRNLEAALAWTGTALPPPARVTIAGSSAGGFGTLLAYDLVRRRWPSTDPASPFVALLDDSGPTFVTTAIPESLRDAWWGAWNLTSTVTPLCPGCRDDLSAIWDVLSQAHPDDRFALLSSTADATIRSFFGGMTGLDFGAALGALAVKLEDLPGANACTFRVSGQDHALLLRPGAYSADGTRLLDWLSDMAAGRQWASQGP